MDQNQEKSVWLKLMLPICLGVFATAIYHNAIKTQKIPVQGFVASNTMKMGESIEIKKWNEAFKTVTLTYHVDSAESTKTPFEAKHIKTALSGSSVVINRQIKEGDLVSVYDFK